LLKSKGIKVERTIQRAWGNYEIDNYEYDIIAENTVDIVIVEVMTTLGPPEVSDLHEKLWKAKRYMPKYKNMTICGAVAFITANEASDRMAENQGLFVIRATSGNSSIVNKADFKPKVFWPKIFFFDDIINKKCYI